MWPFRKRNQPPPPTPKWLLSDPVLWFSGRDPWTIGDACQGCQIWGSTGSGKSSGSLAWIVRSYLSMGFGGIFLTSKPGDRDVYEGYCRATGRFEDVVLFGPGHPARFNFIDSELQRKDRGAGHVENLVSLFSTILEISDRNRNRGGGEGDQYWKLTNRQLTRNAMELLIQAKGTITIPDLYRLVLSAPTSFEMLQSETWRASSFCFQCLTEADAKVSAVKRADLQLATDFFCVEWPNLSEKTRSIVQSVLTSMLDILNRGVARTLLSSSETTVRPEMACDGKIILVDMPLKLFGEVGQFVQTVWKYCFQQAMERRDIAANPRPVFIVVDESHLLATSSDQVFQTTARSSRTAVVYATQSISNYLAAFGGEQSEAEVHSLLGNLQTQFFHQQADTRTNTYAADLIGRTKQYFMNSNSNWGPVDWSNVLFGGRTDTGSSAGMSEQFEFEVQPSEFTTLRQGGPPDWLVDAIVVRGGKRFAQTGRPWLPVTIRQQF